MFLVATSFFSNQRESKGTFVIYICAQSRGPGNLELGSRGVPEKIRVFVQVLRESNTWRFSSLPLYLCPFIVQRKLPPLARNAI